MKKKEILFRLKAINSALQAHNAMENIIEGIETKSDKLLRSELRLLKPKIKTLGNECITNNLKELYKSKKPLGPSTVKDFLQFYMSEIMKAIRKVVSDCCIKQP